MFINFVPLATFLSFWKHLASHLSVMLHSFLDVFPRSLGMCSSSHSTESELEPESTQYYKEQIKQQNVWLIVFEHCGDSRQWWANAGLPK